MSGLEVLSRLRATRSQTELPVIMVTAQGTKRRHRRGAQPWSQRLHHQADRLPRCARAHPHAPVAQMGRRGPARERRTVRGCRARRERRALGLEYRRPTRCTGPRAGKRCWDTKSRKSAPTHDEWLSRIHHEDAQRRRTRSTRTSRAEPATTKANIGSATATARIAGCAAAARR